MTTLCRERLRAVTGCLWLAVAVVCTPATAGEVPQIEDLLEMTVSSAARRPQSPAEAPSMVSVITAAEIRSFGWRNLGEALSSLSGVHVSYDRSYSYMGIRGFGRPGDFTSRVLLMIDGHPINDGIYDQASVGSEFPLDMSLVDRIEYVPGAGSVMYGGNAILAVVNLVTRTGAGVGRSLSVDLATGGGVGAIATAGWRDASGNDGVVSVARERSRGRDLYFESYQSGAANAWSRGLDHEANDSLFAQFRRGGFAAALILHERQKGLPGGPFGIDLNHPGSQVRDRRMQGNLRYEHQIDPMTSLNLGAYAMDIRYDGHWFYSGVDQPDGMEARSLGGEASLTSRAWAGHTWLAGVSLRRDGTRRQFNASLDSNSPRSAVGVFVQDDMAFGESFTLSAGLRFDQVSGGHRHSSPRFALIYRPGPRTVIKAIAGSAFRPPNAYETDYAFTGTNIANPDLRSERSRTGELGLLHELGNTADVGGSLYRTRLEDLITIERNPGTNLQQHHNVGRVVARGLEVYGRGRIGAATLRGSLAWQSVRHESGAELANTPRQLAKLLVDLPLHDGLRLGFETRYTGARTADSGQISRGGSEVGGNSVSHLTLGGMFSREFEWQLKISNLFDRNYGNVVGTEFSNNFPGVQQSPMPLVIQDGRTLSAQLRWSF
ncbi:MAG: TonB-dependent receptor [Rhodocyclales bacterium]|nr:TonB-dependent receptor [Rhodocyclales bacterium]